MDELLEQAAEIARLVKSPNVSEAKAAATIQQLVRTAYSQGCLAGTTHTSNMMTRTFDAILSR